MPSLERSFLLKDVRCFTDPGPALLRPLTILVGENSSGKSSFLALARTALEMAQGKFIPNFNREPFFLGAYDQVAHTKGGRGGRSTQFSLGWKMETPPAAGAAPNVTTLIGEFVKHGSQPILSCLRFSSDPYKITFHFEENVRIHITTPSWSGPLPTQRLRFRNKSSIDFHYVSYFLDHIIDLVGQIKDAPPVLMSRDDATQLSRRWMTTLRVLDIEPYAIAPVRTSPARTYDPVDDSPSAGGTHVPLVLAKTVHTDKEQWKKIKTWLDTFGKESGLFEEIKVKTLGRSESDPFQIMVKIAGPFSNLIDVGYGVSQVLPVIVDLVNGTRRRMMYLLQQPEIHLHPKGQAALATFFAQFLKTVPGHTVVVETHSDYLIDRIRTDVRARSGLQPSDISILYFERKKRAVKIHRMELDEQGNLLHAPRNYRNFFILEEQRMLGL